MQQQRRRGCGAASSGGRRLVPLTERATKTGVALVVLFAAACGAAETPVVVRRIDGERRAGHFVSPFSYEHFIRGEIALAHGDLAHAAEQFELARAGPEEDPLVLARLVEVLDRLDRRAEADEVLRGALQTFPEAETLWLTRGRLAERRGDMRRAIASYERAEAMAPRSELGPIALADLLASNDAPGRADAVLARFVRRAPERSPAALRARMRLALIRGDARTAVRTIRALVRVAPARADEVEEVANAALAEGHPALAASVLDAMPRGLVDPALHVRALAEAGRFDRAEAILAATPADALGGPVTEARLYLAAGMAERADELADAIAITEPGPDVWLVSGLAKLALGRFDEAAARLAKVPRGARGYVEARLALARTLRARSLDALAADVLSESLSGAVDDEAALREALADARLATGDETLALAAVEPLEGPRGLAARARVLEQTGRMDEASDLWARVPPDAPGITARTRLRSRAARMLADGERERALRLLSRWVARAPEDELTRARFEQLGGVVGAENDVPPPRARARNSVTE